MTFSNLIGNNQAKALLSKLAEQERDSHVLLFSGAPRVGKKSFVTAFLSKLLGKEHEDKIQKKVHPDVIWLRPEGKLNLHSVASIKKMIDESTLFPFEAKKKVYVIEEADRMLPSSSNALLKMLEEPPSHVSCILLTSHEEGILPTLLSRCSKIPFYPIEEDLIVKALEEAGKEPELIKKVVASSQGSLTEALELLTEKKNPAQGYFVEILRHFFMQTPSLAMAEALDSLDKLIEEEAGELVSSSQVAERLLDDFIFWIRDLNYKKAHPEGKDLLHEEHIVDLDRQLQSEVPTMETGLLLMEKGRLALQRGIKSKVVFENLLMQAKELSWSSYES